MEGSWSAGLRAEMGCAAHGVGCCCAGVSGCKHPGAFVCKSVSQTWLLVMPRETETQFQFCGDSVMVGAEQQEEGKNMNVERVMLFAGYSGLHRALGT